MRYYIFRVRALIDNKGVKHLSSGVSLEYPNSKDIVGEFLNIDDALECLKGYSSLVKKMEFNKYEVEEYLLVEDSNEKGNFEVIETRPLKL